MKRSYQASLFVLCLGILSAASSYALPSWTWALKPIGHKGTGFYSNSINGVSIDDFGNSYVAGQFNDSATFIANIMQSYNGLDIYLAKVDSNGTFQWVRTIGGWYAQDIGIDVATDSIGNAYLLGYFADSVDVSGTIVRRTAFSSVVIAKYNSSGTLQWARPATGLSVANLGGIAYSPEGYLYVGNSVTLGKYSLAGDSIWTIQPSIDSGQILINDVDVSPDGNFVYYTGLLTGAINVGGVHLTSGSLSDWDIFLIKADKDGNVIWGKSAGSENNLYDQGWGIDVDHSGNVYLCGQYSGVAHFGADSIDAQTASWAMFVAKYDGAGDIQWVKGGSATNNVYFSVGQDVKLVSNETEILVAGTFNTQFDFQGSSFFCSGGDAIVTRLSAADGALQWGKQSGSTTAIITVNAMDVNRNTSKMTLVGRHTSFTAVFTPFTFTTPKTFSGDGWIVGGTTDSPTPVKERPSDVLPTSMLLKQNYPNPFNPTTTISFDIPSRSQVNVTVYNILGEHVKTLVDQELTVGAYTVEWNGTDAAGKTVATGVYLYRIQAGDQVETRKMMLVK